MYQEQIIDLAHIKNYIGKVSTNRIEDHVRKGLNDPTEVEEIEMAIKQAKVGKMPRTDGIPTKVYKLLKNELSLILKRIFDNLLATGEILESCQEVLITLIPKEGQDLSNVKNYRHISILNDDYKI